MIKYDFDKIIPRKGTNCWKWDKLEEVFHNDKALPMWIADMDFQSPQPVIDALHKRVDQGLFAYDQPSPNYNDSIVEWVKKRHGWTINKDWLSFSQGISMGMALIIRALTHPGDKVIVQTPVYSPFSSISRNNGCQVVENKLILKDGKYHVDFEDLEEKAKDPRVKLFLLCNPHNPVGRVWTREELKRMAEICVKNDVVIISDEAHCDFVYRGYKHTPIASLGDEIAQNTITFGSPSKTFNLGGLFAAYVITPNKKHKEAYSIVYESSRFDTGLFGLIALETAYRECEDYVEQLIDYLKGNLDFLTNYLSEKINKIKVIQPEGTYVAWLDCRELHLDKMTLSDFMVNKANIALEDGYWFGDNGDGFMRLNMACPRSILEEGLKRIEGAVNEYIK